jgi:hypothetical protein
MYQGWTWLVKGKYHTVLTSKFRQAIRELNHKEGIWRWGRGEQALGTHAPGVNEAVKAGRNHTWKL